jgi:hypothetical protein
VPAHIHHSPPAQEDVAGGLHHPLPPHHPLAGLFVAALRQVILQHRRGGLLDLQEQRVPCVTSLEQDDERAGADAAHAHDLAGHVHDLKTVQQMTPIVLQRGSVGAQLLTNGLCSAPENRNRPR